MENMVELYTPDHVARWERKRKIGIALLCAVLALGLAGCVLLCLHTTTGNAGRMELAAILTASVSGWIALGLWSLVVRPAGADAAHARIMLTGPRESLTGRVSVTRERVWIKGNITLRTVYVSTREGLRRVSVNERRVRALQGAGEWLTLSTVGGYVAAWAPAGPGPVKGEPPEAGSRGLGWRTSVFGKLLSQVHVYVLWALACVFLWSWVFTRVTNAPAEEKITIFVDAPALEDTALAVELEREMPEGILMIKVRPTSYAMMSGNELESADIFILRESELETYQIYLVPGGTKIYDAETAAGPAGAYITYVPAGETGEDYYLFYGAGSVHTGELDTAAFQVAEHLLGLQ